MSERQVVLKMGEARARMLREGIARNRFWLDGFRDAKPNSTVVLLEPVLIQLQIEFEKAFAELPKKKVKT